MKITDLRIHQPVGLLRLITDGPLDAYTSPAASARAA